MFDNIGGKIKTVATTIAWLGIIGSIIIGIVMIAKAEDSYYPEIGIWSGWLVIIVGSLSSWVSSFTLYGFGQLIENTDAISSEMESIRRVTSKHITNASDKAQSSSNGVKSSTNSNDTISYTNLDPCLGTCELCDKENVKVARCKIVDSMGRRYYYYLCADCMKEYNAVPIKK